MPARDPSTLSVYVNPGPWIDTRAAEDQAVAAERIGFGSIWFSELQGPMKDAGAVLGFLAHATDKIQLGTSISHFGTRHPMVQASWGLTMQALSRGRFQMGFGRGQDVVWRAFGLPSPTNKSMGDYADILRRLWAREEVCYEGPAGSFPKLHIGEFPDDIAPPPLLLSGIGDNTMRLVGRSFDGVFLMPFTTLERVARARLAVREEAERVGRDPSKVRIIAQVITVPNGSDRDFDHQLRSRLASYLMHGVGDALCEANRWDIAPVDALRVEGGKVAARFPGKEGPSLRAALIDAARVLPDEWLFDTSATGTPSSCAQRIQDFLDAGADEVTLHGTTAEHLEATVRAFVEGD